VHLQQAARLLLLLLLLLPRLSLPPLLWRDMRLAGACPSGRRRRLGGRMAPRGAGGGEVLLLSLCQEQN
jgi:hypothetical protein